MATKLQTDRKETVTASTLYSQGNSENLEQCREAREKWKNIACFDEPWLMLQHLDGKINIWWEKKNEGMAPSCIHVVSKCGLKLYKLYNLVQ